MKLIVGLGNPGDKYKDTRHNAGFIALDELARANSLEFKASSKHFGDLAEGMIQNEKVILLKPQTFMNVSGKAVASVSNFYKIDPEDIIVLFDDVDIKSGELRLRTEGSAGGHNGIKSIIASLGTDAFTRVRIGVAPIQEFNGDLADYVLGRISKEEEGVLMPVIENIPSVIDTILTESVEVAQNKYN